MKFVLIKENKYLYNIVPGFNKIRTKAVLTDNEEIALIFYSKSDAEEQAKRFKLSVKQI